MNYLAVPELVAEQRSEVMRRINERPVATAVHPPLDWSQAVTGGAADHYLRNLASIPGLTQAGWNPESIVTRRRETDLGGMSTALLAFADQMIAHDDSWPFRDAVDLSVVPDYLSVVKEPMGEWALAGSSGRVDGSARISSTFLRRSYLTQPIPPRVPVPLSPRGRPRHPAGQCAGGALPVAGALPGGCGAHLRQLPQVQVSGAASSATLDLTPTHHHNYRLDSH